MVSHEATGAAVMAGYRRQAPAGVRLKTPIGAHCAYVQSVRFQGLETLAINP